MSKLSIAVIYTGGTFGMAENKAGLLQPLALPAIATALQTAATAGIPFRLLPVKSVAGEPLAPIDSSVVSPGFWRALASTVAAALTEFDRVIVLHGTDTMAYSLAAMGFALGSSAGRVIFTGSQRPLLSDASDAAANFNDALLAVGELPVVGRGPWLVFGGQRLAGMRVSKAHSYADRAFIERAVGPVSRRAEHAAADFKLREGRYAFASGVADIVLTPATTAELLLNQLTAAGTRAAVLRLYGSGTSHLPLADIVGRAQLAGLQLAVGVSACHHGGLQAGVYATDATVELPIELPGELPGELPVKPVTEKTGCTKAGDRQECDITTLVSAADMTAEAAVVKLMWLLANVTQQEQVYRGFRLNVVGEYGA